MKHPTRTSRLVLWLEKYLAWLLLSLLRRTYRYHVHGDPLPSPRVIYLFWHQHLLTLLLHRSYENIGVMISASFDGELIAGPTEMFGYTAIRGSSTRQGISALKKMVRHGQNHCLAITPDGPRGPAFHLKEGVAYLALLGRLPLVPIRVEVRHKWQFNSWDRFILPKPFSRIDVYYLDPVTVPTSEDLPGACARLQALLQPSDRGTAAVP